MVLELFGSLKAAIKPHDIAIDGLVSKFHYRFTVCLLFLFCLLVTSRQYFGDPIACQPSTPNEILPAVLDTYCWIHATFTLPSAFDKKVGEFVAHPGVAPSLKDDKRQYHRYYQWVWFVLLLQLVLFYLPHFIWKCLESGTIKKTLLDLNLPVHRDEKKRTDDCHLLASYLYETLGCHNWYVFRYALCEVLNFVNVICQIYLIDAFLDGEFSTYGVDVLKFSEYDQEDRSDPMIKIFPRVTKCLFHRYGSSGDIQRHDALCILPLNIVNEKIFIVMWFWFVALATITGLWLVVCIPLVFWKKSRFYVLKGASRFSKREDVSAVCHDINIGDWFLLYLLCRNMDQVNFRKVLKRLKLLMSGVQNKDNIRELSKFDESMA